MTAARCRPRPPASRTVSAPAGTTGYGRPDTVCPPWWCDFVEWAREVLSRAMVAEVAQLT